MGCTPIVNLFRQRAEPIRLDNRAAEYRVVPDARRVGATEVYAIEAVTASAPDGRSRSFEPFFGLHASSSENEDIAYWHASRRLSENGDGGTEVFLSFVDGDFDPAAPVDYTVSVETLCLNRDLPSRLPFGGGNPRLELVEASPGDRAASYASPRRPRRCGRRSAAARDGGSSRTWCSTICRLPARKTAPTRCAPFSSSMIFTIRRRPGR